MKSEIISIETKYSGWARFLVVSVRLPDGQLIKREIEDHGNAVAVLAFDPERKMAALVRQFRAPPFFSLGQEHTLEAIAGIIDDVDSITAARREALEETGLRLQSLERVATVWSMPGISTEGMNSFPCGLCASRSGCRRWRHCGGARKYYGSGDGARQACRDDGRWRSRGHEDARARSSIENTTP